MRAKSAGAGAKALTSSTMLAPPRSAQLVRAERLRYPRREEHGGHDQRPSPSSIQPADMAVSRRSASGM
jgi:hypothetical protein